MKYGWRNSAHMCLKARNFPWYLTSLIFRILLYISKLRMPVQVLYRKQIEKWDTYIEIRFVATSFEKCIFYRIIDILRNAYILYILVKYHMYEYLRYVSCVDTLHIYLVRFRNREYLKRCKCRRVGNCSWTKPVTNQ